MKVALGQFAVDREWQNNARHCTDLMEQADSHGADLLVLPEGVIARDVHDADWARRHAQPLDGPFLAQLLQASKGLRLATAMCVHVTTTSERAANVLVVVRDGVIEARYQKLHLYDAFAAKESDFVEPGDALPPVVRITGMGVGLMTCYDVRFPEVARHLALNGADALLLPAAWPRGPMKEAHWDVMITARALENTCYVVAVGECSVRNIGASMVVDPLGVATVRAGEGPALLYAELEPGRVAEARKALPVLVNRRFAAPVLAAGSAR